MSHFDWQAIARDEPYQPLLKASTQKLRTTWCLRIPNVLGLECMSNVINAQLSIFLQGITSSMQW
eukprot:1160508-Pelagomonas_calceolata.AAC.11